MKKFYYVILSMIAIALVSCTSELDEINNTVHQQETLSGNELGANLMKSFQNAVVYTPDDMNIAGTLIGGVTNSNPSYFMPASRTVEKYGLELY